MARASWSNPARSCRLGARTSGIDSLPPSVKCCPATTHLERARLEFWARDQLLSTRFVLFTDNVDVRLRLYDLKVFDRAPCPAREQVVEEEAGFGVASCHRLGLLPAGMDRRFG